MSPDQIDLSIIIPAYKEAETINERLHTLGDYLKDHDYGRVEVLVLAQSDDDTGAAAAHDAKYFHDFRVINLGKRSGKGGAVRAGMFEARGRYRMFMDADLATPLHHLDDVKALMDRGGKVGIAVRDLVSIHKEFMRKAITGGGNLLAQIILLPGLKDTQCGFKVFEAEAAEAIFSRMTIVGWGFDLEILAVARKLGYKIETFEAPDWKDPKAEGQGLVGDSASGAAVQVLRDLFKVRFNLIRGLYNEINYTHTPAGN
jgi:dolichyl-phosphate beta-glucosyltransferase